MKRPKRSRKKDNPYTLEVSDEKYYVLFKDSKNILRNIEVRKDVFDLMDRFELDDVCEINEYKRHIEHSEIYERTINSRSVDKQENLEDIILKKYEYQDLLNFINKLSEVQKRRLIKYYFQNKNIYQIAEEENTTHQSIAKSLKLALEKLKEFYKISKK